MDSHDKNCKHAVAYTQPFQFTPALYPSHFLSLSFVFALVRTQNVEPSSHVRTRTVQEPRGTIRRQVYTLVCEAIRRGEITHAFVNNKMPVPKKRINERKEEKKRKQQKYVKGTFL